MAVGADAKKTAGVVPLFRRGPNIADEEELQVGLPPTRALARAVDAVTAAPLGMPPAWFLIGAGGSGKTTLARWMAGRTKDAGRVALAALDPTNRTLAGFAEGVMQPDSADPAHTARWLREMVEWLMQARGAAILDMGGGDTSLAKLISEAPTFAADMKEAGVAPVATYVLSPRVDDLSALVSFEAAGFQPAETVLVLNEARVDATMIREEAFARVMAHSAFRGAVARGARVIWMPALDQELALEIESKRLQFGQARDGIVPSGRSVTPIGGLRRSLVRRWLERMETEFAPVSAWLP